MKVDSGNFQVEILKLLKEYGDGVIACVEKTVELEANRGVKLLKNTSPKLTGDYRKGWAKQVKYKPYGAEATVYNKTEYRLTHLLENGHAKRNGGRVAPIPHIGPTNEELEMYFESDLRKALSEL